ncbi:hypothetical protein [Mycoplasmopsis adleri]|uniref:hypothetical protein n=1 Tax=Mycoplasmopsis adleri TaxID=51362 RepID=UPI0038730107
MLNSITIKNHKGEQKTINFSKVNLIIGSKGTGKSTLLEIIAEAIANKSIYPEKKNWYETDENNGFMVEKVTINNLDRYRKDYSFIYEKPTSKNTIEGGILSLQDIIPGYISQNDTRKFSLDSSNVVKETKNNVTTKFINSIVSDNKVHEGLKIFYDIKDLLIDYNNLINQSINFSVIFDKALLETKDIKLNKLYTTVYDSASEIRDIHNFQKALIEQQDSLKDTVKKINSENKSLQEFSDKFQNYEIFSEEFKDKFADQSSKTIEEILKYIETLDIATSKLEKVEKAFQCFKKAYSQVSNNIKQQNSNIENKLNEFTNLKHYFAQAAIQLKKINEKYSSLKQAKIDIDWSCSEKDKKNSNLEYRLDKFTIDSEDDINALSNKIFKASNKSYDITDLFTTNNPGAPVKEADIVKFLISDKVNVYAGDKMYKDLSMGQKTLFGVTHTIKTLNNYSNSEYLLLDQIEDNLDSRTVYKDILPLLQDEAKKNKQIFIITHNPNIGILNGSTITTDIMNEGLSKKFVVDEPIYNETDNPQVYFLEGGIDAFNKRREIYEELEDKINKLKKGEQND